MAICERISYAMLGAQYRGLVGIIRRWLYGLAVFVGLIDAAIWFSVPK